MNLLLSSPPSNYMLLSIEMEEDVRALPWETVSLGHNGHGDTLAAPRGVPSPVTRNAVSRPLFGCAGCPRHFVLHGNDVAVSDGGSKNTI